MTAVLDERTETAPERPGALRSRLPVGTTRRRPVLAVASALVVFASIAVFAGVYSSAARQSEDLVAAQTIQQGQTFVAADLTQASVSVPAGLSAIPVADAHLLAGKRAAVTVPAGALLTAADLSSAPQIGSGDAVVGLALKDGQYPASGVSPGDQVMIVQTAGPGTPLAAPTTGAGATTTSTSAGAGAGAGATTGVLVPQATVFDVSAPSSATGSGLALLVSVDVPSTEAAAVSIAASADQVSLVLLPAGSASSPTSGQSAQGGGQG